MSTPEFLTWIEFHKLYPLDDYHRLFKPAAMLAAVHTKDGKLQPFIDMLSPDPRNAGLSEADLNSMRAFGVSSKGA